MAVLLVTYEFKTPNKEYGPFYEAVKKNSEGWWHYIDHVWIVNTTMSADQFAKALYPHITKSDSLLVVRLRREHQGWLPEEAWKWLNEREY
jgi:hypothetical protein